MTSKYYDYNYDSIVNVDPNNSMNSSGINTITLTGVGDTIDLSSSTYSYNNSWSSSNWSTGTLFTNSTVSPSVNLNDNGIEIKESGDIKIGHRSLKTFMEKMEERLAILQPDPELLEKYEALRQAYEHYKTLEALCSGDPPKDPNNG